MVLMIMQFTTSPVSAETKLAQSKIKTSGFLNLAKNCHSKELLRCALKVLRPTVCKRWAASSASRPACGVAICEGTDGSSHQLDFCMHHSSFVALGKT